MVPPPRRARQEVLRKTESLWSDPIKATTSPKRCRRKGLGAGRRRERVIIVTGPLGGGKSSVVRHLAARDALVVTHRYWRWPGAPRRRLRATMASIARAFFDFGNACVCCAPDGDLQALLKKEEIGPVRPHRDDGHGGPGAVRRRLPSPGRGLGSWRVLRSVVFVADARGAVRKQLAVPDSPGAPNPHRLPAAANHAVLTRGGEPLRCPGSPVRSTTICRGATPLRGLTRQPSSRGGQTFLGMDPAGDHAGSSARGCRSHRPTVCCGPWPSWSKARRAKPTCWRSRRTSTRLPRSTGLRIAADGASTGALLVDGGRGGEALRVVRLDDGVAPDDDASTASSASSEAADVDAGDWRREAAPQLRLFVLGTKLDAASLREGLRACLVPRLPLRR